MVVIVISGGNCYRLYSLQTGVVFVHNSISAYGVGINSVTMRDPAPVVGLSPRDPLNGFAGLLAWHTVFLNKYPERCVQSTSGQYVQYTSDTYCQTLNLTLLLC